jgi:EpsD family peptidyl-prolyl cis-trans isomerase
MFSSNTRCAAAPGFAAVLTLLNLGACTHHSQASSQVVAKVNDREITVSQLNQALNVIDPDTLTPDVTRRAISSLVDEELLVQSAVESRLDRDPATVAAMERARRQVLAAAYAERVLYPKSPVTLADEEKYFKQNPGLFERRKLYRLTVYTVQPSDMSDLLKADLDTVHSAEQVRDTLEKHQIKYETQHLNTPAEDLPLGKIKEFSEASVGDLLIANGSDGRILLISIVALEDRPLSFEAAKPAIDAFLIKTRNTEAINEHLKAEKKAASISYVGQFAQYAAAVKK